MNIRNTRFLLVFALTLIISCKTTGVSEESFVEMKTSAGVIKLKLYDETPLHKENFLTLVNSGFYDGILFHRVIKDFMIQAGDPLTNQSEKIYPDSLNNYTIPAEFNPSLYHKKGALAAARQGNDINPYMRSSGTQFYIVQGKSYNDEELDNAELRINSQIQQGRFNIYIKEVTDSLILTGLPYSDSQVQEIASSKMFRYLTDTPDFIFSEEQRNTYKTYGGTPRLDGTYTVFGEVVEGLEIVDRIAEEKTNNADKPLNNIVILKARIIRK